MSGAAVSALTRPNDFRPLSVLNPSPTITSWRRDQGPPRRGAEPASPPPLSTLAESVRVQIEQFVEALTDAHELSNAMIAEREISPIDAPTVNYAIQSLVPLIMSLKLPPPLILPLQNGGIGIEWHASGMNVELRFRKPYEVYAIFEDARGVIATYQGRDPYLVQARSALSQLNARAPR
jgi:hypothetical protein